MISVMPKKQPLWNIVTPMPFYQSSESRITMVLMMLFVKPRPCIQSLTFHPSISAFRSQRPFSPISQTIRTRFLERRCPSPSPLRSRRLREKKPVRLKTPSLMMPKMFYPFILYKYFENNYVLPVKYWVNLYPLHL